MYKCLYIYVDDVWTSHVLQYLHFYFSITKEDLREAARMSMDQEVVCLPDDTDQDPVPDVEPGVVLETDPHRLLQQDCCLAYEDCLTALARTNITSDCPQCNSTYAISSNKVGTALYLTWVHL